MLRCGVFLGLPKPVSEQTLPPMIKPASSNPVAAKSQIRVRPNRVRIADVAEALGVTKSTVSRALNGYPDISEGTRLRIKRAADTMGYRPLSHAQAIRTGRVRALGLIVEVGEYDAHRPFLAEFLAGVTRGASAESWTLTVATSVSAEDTQSTLARLVEEHKADGFILPRTRLEDPRVQFLREQGVPFVLYGRTRDATDCAWFDIVSEDAIEQAVARLAAQGHRRIAFVNAGREYNFAHVRHQGYLSGLHAAGLDHDASLIMGDAVTSQDGQAATLKLLALASPPTAIVFATDKAAMGSYLAASDLGLTIGRDISVISYDGLPEGAFAQPGLTTYAVDTNHAGERLAKLLIERIRGTAPEDLRELAPAQLVARGSDGPPTLTSKELAARLSRDEGPINGRKS